MGDRRHFTYSHRVTTDSRTMDPERNTTDGNTDEVRSEVPNVPAVAEIPTGVSNAMIDTFTQMMAAVTQVIQHSHNQPQPSSRSESSVDKHLKLFQDMQPPLYSGVGEALDAENWLMRIEKMLEGMHCPNDKCVSLATFALNGEAEMWWRRQQQEKFSGRTTDQISWEEFVKVFREWFVPLSARSQMQDRFIRLVQGERTVMQYEAEFTMLSKYAGQLIPTAKEKCHRFLSGLRDMIRQPLIPFGLDDYSVLVERARRLEIDFQVTQKRRDFQKRKSLERSESLQTSVNSRVQKARTDSTGSSSSAATCQRCGKTHRGECLSGSNICFICRQPGHISKNCSRGPREVRPSAHLTQQGFSKQETVGRPRMQESSASVPSQQATRPTVQPRVYAITQQEAKESPDVITGLYMGDGNLQNQDKLILRGLQFYGFHGVHPEEKKKGQRFFVDIDAWLDLRIAGETDDITDTVSYTDIYRIAKEIMEGPSKNLLESVAHLIANTTLLKHPQIHAVRVKVGKPDILIDGSMDYLGIEIIRSRVKNENK